MSTHRFQGRQASLATRHGKLPLIAPPLERELGLTVTSVDIDTDAFGTFTGDVERRGTARETAIAKARAGMAASGSTLGVASEGTIGPDPVTGLLSRDTELVVLVDDLTGLVIMGEAFSYDIVNGRHVVAGSVELETMLRRLDVPRHAVLVMPEEMPWACRKGLRDPQAIAAALEQARGSSSTGRAVLASDLRAQYSPSRQAVIARAAVALATRAATPCPRCGQPGWGRVDWLLGRICRECGGAIHDIVRGVIEGCEGCGHRQENETDDSPVGPAHCPTCNP